MFEEKELLYLNDFSNKSSFSLLSLDLSIKMNDHSQKTEKKEENEEIMLFYAKPRKLSIDERNSTILRIEELNASNDFSTHNELNDLSFPTKFINYDNNILITDENQKINGKNKENEKKFEKCESIYRLIEKHLNTKDNSLCILKEYYMNYFINKYENLLSSDYRLQKNKEWLDKYEFMILDFRQFISLFQESITLFYDLENISKSLSLPENFFSSDNLINFLLNIMFNEEIYYILFEVQRKIDRFDEIMFRRSLKLVKNYTFDRFLIPEKYFLKNSKISPYSESINIIKNIGFIKSPTHKMRLIIQASELIEKQMIFSSKNNEITSEDYLAILSYVISKSKVTNLISQLNLMEKFLTKTNLTEKNGNFFYMMKAASEYLLNIGIDE